jgi:hypothetical protein
MKLDFFSSYARIEAGGQSPNTQGSARRRVAAIDHDGLDLARAAAAEGRCLVVFG